MVDTLGLLIQAYVGVANQGDRDGLFILFWKSRDKLIRLLKAVVDGGYEGKDFEGIITMLFGWILEVKKRPEEQKGFEVIPIRWIAERTFAWLFRYRRLTNDYEVLPQRSESMIYLGMIKLMLRRLTGRASYCPIGYCPKPNRLIPL